MIRDKRHAIKAALLEKLNVDAVLVLLAMIARFPRGVVDAAGMVADFNHAAIAEDLGLSFREYTAAMKELGKSGFVSRKRIRARGKMTVIHFDELDKLGAGDENAL